MTAQLTLDLPHRAALGREDYFVAGCNEQAVAWLDRSDDWPGGVLIVHGPPASGKTHLTEVWREISGATRLAAADLETAAADLVAGGALVFDDAEAAAGDAAREEALFHLLNAVKAAEARLLMTAARPAGRWPVGLPDLASRLKAAQSVALGPPDDALLQALVIKLFSDRQLRIAPEVITFLTSRTERSFAGVEALVDALDRHAMATKREITVPLARQVLKTIETGEDD